MASAAERRKNRTIREQLVLSALPPRGEAYRFLRELYASRAIVDAAEVKQRINSMRRQRHTAFPTNVASAAIAAMQRAERGQWGGGIDTDSEDEDNDGMVLVTVHPPLEAAPAPAMGAPAQTAPAAMIDDESSSSSEDEEEDDAHVGHKFVRFIAIAAGRLEWSGEQNMAAVYDALNKCADDVDCVMVISSMLSTQAAIVASREVLHNERLARTFQDSLAAEEERKRREATLKECPICMERYEELVHTSLCCKHEVCLPCLGEAIINGLAVARTVACPCCKPSSSDFDVKDAAAYVPPAALHLVDPLVFNRVSRDEFGKGLSVPVPPRVAAVRDRIKLAKERFLRSEQMGPFIGTEFASPSKCPRCNSWATTRMPDKKIARCPNPGCAELFCVDCKEGAHPGKSCEQAMGAARAEMDLESANYARKTSKACPNCKAPISHFNRHGCHHMTCGNCTFQFCYVCMKPWPLNSENKYCHCPLWCDQTCGCANCDECRPGKPCKICGGRCLVCDPRAI